MTTVTCCVVLCVMLTNPQMSGLVAPRGSISIRIRFAAASAGSAPYRSALGGQLYRISVNTAATERHGSCRRPVRDTRSTAQVSRGILVGSGEFLFERTASDHARPSTWTRPAGRVGRASSRSVFTRACRSFGQPIRRRVADRYTAGRAPCGATRLTDYKGAAMATRSTLSASRWPKRSCASLKQ